MLDATVKAVRDQNLEGGYLIQAFPVIGIIPSIALALFTGASSVAKIAQAFFKSFGDTTAGPLQQEIKDNWKSAKDYGLLFANNILNICTLGILNSFLVHKEMNAINEFYTRGDY